MAGSVCERGARTMAPKPACTALSLEAVTDSPFILTTLFCIRVTLHLAAPSTLICAMAPLDTIPPGLPADAGAYSGGISELMFRSNFSPRMRSYKSSTSFVVDSKCEEASYDLEM